MSHALEQMKAVGRGVICHSSSSKLPTSCLHGYCVSLWKIHGSTFFWEEIFATPQIVLTGTIHTLAWKMRVEKCPLSFWYGILPGSFGFQTWCGDFHFWESIKNSVEQAKQLTWCQYSQKCKKLEKGWRRQGHFVRCVVFLQYSEIESDCFEIFQSQFGNPLEFLWGTACWSKKQNTGLLSGTAKCILLDNVTCAMVKSRYIGDGHPTFNRNPYNNWYIKPYYWVDDHPLLYGNNGSLDPSTHALEQMKAAGREVTCQSSSSKLPSSCLHDYSASLRKIHGSTFF